MRQLPNSWIRRGHCTASTDSEVSSGPAGQDVSLELDAVHGPRTPHSIASSITQKWPMPGPVCGTFSPADTTTLRTSLAATRPSAVHPFCRGRSRRTRHRRLVLEHTTSPCRSGSASVWCSDGRGNGLGLRLWARRRRRAGVVLGAAGVSAGGCCGWCCRRFAAAAFAAAAFACAARVGGVGGGWRRACSTGCGRADRGVESGRR